MLYLNERTERAIFSEQLHIKSTLKQSTFDRELLQYFGDQLVKMLAMCVSLNCQEASGAYQ